MDNLDLIKTDKELETKVKKIVATYLQRSAFSDRKLTDTPSDNLQVVPRQYVTLNGTSIHRPTASVVGQFYYDTTIGKPIWWAGSSFKDAAGNVV